MIGGRSALLGAAGGGNPYGNWTGNYSDVSLLLRNGTPSTVLIPLDESPSPKAITDFGNAAISTSIKKYGTSSMVFDGSGDYFDTPATTAFDFGNNPFTIEAWINVSVSKSNGIFANMNGRWSDSPVLAGYLFYVSSTGQLAFQEYDGIPSALYVFQSASGLIQPGQWYHVAVCKQGTGTNQLRLFIDGQVVGSFTRNANIPLNTSGQPGRIGSSRQGAGTPSDFNGYIDDLRITKGVARYTKNFLPPPAELPAI